MYVAQRTFLEIPVAYILPSLSFSMPLPTPPTREQLRRAAARAVTTACWAVAVTLTAGRLARIGFEWARPFLAKALHALAIALDGGLLYPDQPEPEPDPTPDPDLSTLAGEPVIPLTEERARQLDELVKGVPVPVSAKPGPTRIIDLGDCVTPAKPRPVRRARAKAPAKEAA